MRAFVESTSWVFVLGATLMWVATSEAAPWVAKTLGADPMLAWFIAVLAVVALPLVVVAGTILRREGRPTAPVLWRQRLRFRPMTSTDRRIALRGIGVVALTSAPLSGLLVALYGLEALHPSFLGELPLGPERRWLLAAWFPFWIINILGEEILWRGIVLPRQESSFGPRAWAFNAVGWGLFHVAFGWMMLVMVLPILIVLPRAVQRTSNSWVGVCIHAALNGPSFVIVSLGLL